MEIKVNKEVEFWEIDKIVPNPKNPNHHPADQIQRLVKIIRAQGFRSPLVVSKRSGLLVSGHGRLTASKIVGLKTLPVLIQDFETEEQEYAAMVAENEIARWAEFERAEFDRVLASLDPSFDRELFGLKQLDGIVDMVNKGDETSEWVDMPEFTPADKEIRLGLVFPDEQSRAEFVEQHGWEITHKRDNQWLIRL